MSSKIKFILIISIILNFLLAGLLLGKCSKSYMHGYDKHQSFSEFADKLPPEKRDMVMKRMDEVRKEKGEIKDQIEQVKKELRDIIAAPQFDEQLYDRKVNEMHELYRSKAKKIASVIKEMAKTFTPEEREMLTEFLENRKHRHKKMHKDYNEEKSESASE